MSLLLILTVFLASFTTTSPELVSDCLAWKSLTVGTYVEEPVRIEREGVVLYGRLLIPNRPGPHPGVILVPGGGQDANYPPRYLASRLARCGVASLIYDKRATGKSEGVWSEMTFEDLLEDASAALNLLQQQPAVDSDQVGIIGFSQGGRFAPALAARNPNVAFLATVSTPFLTARDTRLYALSKAFQQAGYKQARHDTLMAWWGTYLKHVETGQAIAPLEKRMARVSMIPQKLRPGKAGIVREGPVFNSLQADPLADIEALQVPFLALYGEKDRVVPVAESIQRLERVVQTPYLESVVVPGVNHSFAYADVWQQRFRFEEFVMQWVLGQVGLLEACRTYPGLLAVTTPERTITPVLQDCAPPVSVGVGTSGPASGQ